MEKINILYNEETLMNRISELADELYKVYGEEEVVFVSVLKGAIFFTVDLAKKFKGDARIDFLRVSSYEGENSTGNINLKIALFISKVNTHLTLLYRFVLYKSV